MRFNFIERVGALNTRQRQYFYQLLANQLTVAMRGVLFFEGMADAERVERAKWLNEIAHRVTFNVFALYKSATEFTDADIWEMIRMNVGKNPLIEPDVEAAIETAYGYVIENESDAASV